MDVQSQCDCNSNPYSCVYSFSTPYHPQGNGQAEWFNRTLIRMLSTLSPAEKSDWKSHLSPITHAYNCSKNETTGFSPFFLMFGQKPQLPVDALLGMYDEENHETDYNTFVKCLKEKLQAAYRLAQVNISKSQSRHLYNRKTRGSSLQIGDRVLVRNVGIRGKHKLAELWENTPYVVSDAPTQDMPVYKVKPENAKGPIKTLHRNLSLPIDVISSKSDLKQSLSNFDETESELRQMHPNGNSDEDILSPDEDSE